MIFFTKLFSVALLLFFCSSTFSATYINFTRLILNENEHDVSFKIENEGDNAVLMQLWTDRGDIMDKPEAIKMPFMILPPIFRLNGHNSRVVRLQLINNQNTLPDNKESLFWLNALEIPQKTNAQEGKAMLQMAFRTRIKIFYRPQALAQYDVEHEIEKIKTLKVHCGNEMCIRIENKSPFHYTLSKITLQSGKEIKNLPSDGIISPFSSLDISLGKLVAVNENIKSFIWIDDYGVERVNLQ
ncbi:molecular chaperone [Klebsiella indica]|uniref:fimbrial biogenesis chaperone n=1 Tax=Klebsiella TaxID=570 RepID=UPI0031B68F46